MTRVYVYSTALVAFAAATAMMIASISVPEWISYSVTTPKGQTFKKHIGLHKSCSSLDDPTCRDFPTQDMCLEGGRYFCSLWRTISFMASLAVILCLAGFVVFGIIIKGGRYKRETAWPFAAAMMSLVSVVQLAIISMVAYLYDHDDQFTVPGWKLDTSWYLATVSGVLCLVSALGLAMSAYVLPPEGGYEFLSDPLDA